MRIGIFEDSAVERLEPITLTQPAFALRCGATNLLERQQRLLGATEVGVAVRPGLRDLVRARFPELAVNDQDWRPSLWTNARWLPPLQPRIDVSSLQVGMVGQAVAYVVAPSGVNLDQKDIDDWLFHCQKNLPHVPAGGSMINYLWDAVDQNGDALCQDWEWFRALHDSGATGGCSVIGPVERLVVAVGAALEPHVVADTRQGPVLIDRGAIVHCFSRLEGPCYVGADSLVLGAKLRGGSSIGPCCRIGGEVEASIVQGYSNKYHDGFLGHSYIGEWVNLAAATQTSDLRNDYGMVRATINGQRIATGRTKIGSYIGDHTKTGLGALLNTGSVIGAFCNVLPSGTLLPTAVPSFCQVNYGVVQERFDLHDLFTAADTVMRRRGCAWTPTHRDFFDSLFETTARRRRKTIQDAEMRRLRRSV